MRVWFDCGLWCYSEEDILQNDCCNANRHQRTRGTPYDEVFRFSYAHSFPIISMRLDVTLSWRHKDDALAIEQTSAHLNFSFLTYWCRCHNEGNVTGNRSIFPISLSAGDKDPAHCMSKRKSKSSPLRRARPARSLSFSSNILYYKLFSNHNHFC